MPHVLRAIVDWLRRGYPEGIPESDYIPLVALLRRRLSDQEVQQIVAEVLGSPDRPIDRVDIQVMITAVTDEMPSEEDLRRVLSRLDPPGWPH
ncbi:DUF3349 domain-containing protein [Nocardia sp. NBC_01329]|uniref:DUF3349 domain-containing protein n=1 Tax=Nocardia sp. NBC_01329 TaxID=2903594 RepID=UPI002E1289EE|nr:DUF3349 domain-containing protein [Nocardia sp. NBC_01329]